MRHADPVSALGKLLLFLPNPCNRKFLQSLRRVSLNHVSLSPLPSSFSSRTFYHCLFWVSHGCAVTIGWGSTICPGVISTYWKPSPHLFFGQQSPSGSSGPCLLACNTQAPRGWLLPHVDVVDSTVEWNNSVPFLPLCFSNDMRAKDGLCLLKHKLFLLSGREGMRSVLPHQHFLYLVVFCLKSVRVCGLSGNKSANLGAGNHLTWF